jgi:hypothetical protein
MNQIVITKHAEGVFKITVMGLGRTEEVYYMAEATIDDNLALLLKKLVIPQ